MNNTKKVFKVTLDNGVVISIEAPNISLAIGILGNVTSLDIIAIEEVNG